MSGLREVMERQVGLGRPPGLVALLARRGSEVVESVGRTAVAGPPMSRDTITADDWSAAAASLLAPTDPTGKPAGPS